MLIRVRFHRVTRRRRKLVVRAEEALVRQQIKNFHRGTRLVVVVQLRRAAGGDETRVDAPELRVQVEEVHADLAERRSIVRERAVAERRPGNRREPAVEDRELLREGRQDRQLLRLEDGQNCRETRLLAERKLETIEERIADLTRMRRLLKRLISECAEGGRPRSCPIIATLSATV